MNNPLSSLSRSQRFIALGVLLAIVGVVAGIIASSGSPPIAIRPATTTTTTATVPTSLAPVVATNRCPLTDLLDTRGVPKRPALAVKIGNEPGGARPQSGLNEADIVFDTPAEGFIMRYIAVFQCRDATDIGPVRSVRWVDWHLVRQFIRPILAFAGGINPNVDQVSNFSWLRAANLLGAGGAAGLRISSRVPPDNLYTSTSALYGLFPKSTSPPRPVFQFSNDLPAGAVPAASLAIDFSAGTDVIWKWDASTQRWLHTYAGTPDIDALTNEPVNATNIVVLSVNYRIGPYIESTGGSGDVESDTIGRGVGYVLRNGHSIKVTWSRKYLVDGFTFTRAGGEVVTLQPGRTWVELVPSGTAMSLVR